MAQWMNATRLRRVLVAAGAVVISVFAIVAALVQLSVLFPRIPALGVVGSLLGDQRGGQFLTFGLLAAAAAIGCWLLGRRRFTAVIGAATVVTLVGAVTTTSAQLSFAQSVGATVASSDIFRIGNAPAPADKVVRFAKVDGTDLRASIWSPSGHTNTASRPAVLWVHGGGFTAGTRDEQASLARTLADQGYPVVSIDYRLNAKNMWSAETGDVVCGLSWMQDHATMLGVDPDRITIVGGSAGGSLALNVAYGLRAHSVHSSCGNTLPSAPKAVAAFYPDADIAGVDRDNGLMPVSDYAATITKEYLGGAPADVPEHLAYADPAHKIHAGLQPTLLVNGGNDLLIRAPRTHAFADRLAAEGNDVTFHEVPYSAHAYDADPHTIGASTTRALLLKFLTAHA